MSTMKLVVVDAQHINGTWRAQPRATGTEQSTKEDTHNGLCDTGVCQQQVTRGWRVGSSSFLPTPVLFCFCIDKLFFLK